MKTVKMNFLLVGFLLLCPFLLSAQTKDSTLKTSTTTSYGIDIFDIIEENPEFPGGEEARQKFLSENIIYPQVAIESNIEGEVVVEFIIEPDGSITNVKINRSVDPSLDAEALRVAKMMPKWKPGKQEGEAVRCQYTMPIIFMLK